MVIPAAIKNKGNISLILSEAIPSIVGEESAHPNCEYQQSQQAGNIILFR